MLKKIHMDIQHETSLPRLHKCKHLNCCLKNSFENFYRFHIQIIDFKKIPFIAGFSAIFLFCFSYLLLVVQGLGRSNGRFVALERKFKSVEKINIYRKNSIIV